MKKFVLQITLLVIVIGMSLFLFAPNAKTPNLPFLPQKPVINQLQINGAMLKVEIADTQTKRNKGLGGRQSMATDEGMLFVFDNLGKPPFWMKGLSFALDFIWIKDDNVVDLLLDIPPPVVGQKDESLRIYVPKVEVNKVLEVNAGVIQRLNIKVGDTIKLSPL